MYSIPSSWLVIALILLILLSAFFSGSETAIMAANRYRLRHLAREGNKAAIRIHQLLLRPDRLLGVVLIGNTFANILASAIATILAVRYFGDLGVLLSTLGLSLLILIIAEIAPKTVAALHSQWVALKVSLIITFLLKLFYPVIWLANAIVNGLLRVLRVSSDGHAQDRLSLEELRSVVMESSGHISSQHQDMLLRIIEMEQITVDDVMIPRNEIYGIDMEDEWEVILREVMESRHTQIPLYRDDIDNVIGILHLREALKLLAANQLTKETCVTLAKEVYFIPEGTPLHIQLLNFRREQCRLGLVVDEYGDIHGLITLEDILEEVVGEFTAEEPSVSKLVHLNPDSSYVVDGSVSLRELNRLLHWHFPVDGPRTLSGLVIEYFEEIPPAQVCMIIADYRIEVVKVQDNMVKTMHVWPPLVKA